MHFVLSVFGCRPDAIKMMPLIRELKRQPSLHTVVLSTGQHGDLLTPIYHFFDIFPDYDLHLMKAGQTLSDLTAALIKAVEPILVKEAPDLVLVHGDTATAYAVTLACYYRKIPVGHVEAGLRTYNLQSPFPEEYYRQTIDKMASLCFAPTKIAEQNLLREGKEPCSVFCTGNTIVDAMQFSGLPQEPSEALKWIGATPFILLTAHRRENLGEPMERMFRAIRRVMEEHPQIKLVYPVHPNPAVKKVAYAAFQDMPNILLTEPLDYASFRNLEQNCYLCLTDSGGIQEECSAIGKPVLILRNVSERTEGLNDGPLRLAGTNAEKIYASLTELLDNPKSYQNLCRQTNVYGDGKSSHRIAEILASMYKNTFTFQNTQY